MNTLQWVEPYPEKCQKWWTVVEESSLISDIWTWHICLCAPSSCIPRNPAVLLQNLQLLIASVVWCVELRGGLPAWLTGRFCRGQFHDMWGTSGVVLLQRRCWRLHLAMAGVSWEVCFGFYVHNLGNQTASNPKLWPSRKSSLVHKERCTPKGILFRNEVLNSLFSDLPSHRIVINRCPSTSEHLGKRVWFKANSIFWQIAFLKKRDQKAHVGQLYSWFLQLARSPKPNGIIYFSMSEGILVLLLKKIKA